CSISLLDCRQGGHKHTITPALIYRTSNVIVGPLRPNENHKPRRMDANHTRLASHFVPAWSAEEWRQRVCLDLASPQLAARHHIQVLDATLFDRLWPEFGIRPCFASAD